MLFAPARLALLKQRKYAYEGLFLCAITDKMKTIELFMPDTNPKEERMSPRYSSNPDKIARVVSALCYLPSLVGFVIGIIYILAKGKFCDAAFFRFHFYQSIFLSVLGFAIMTIAEGSSSILMGFLRLLAPLIGEGAVNVMLQNSAITMTVLLSPLVVASIYGIIWALLGKTTKIPFVTKLVDNMLRQ